MGLEKLIPVISKLMSVFSNFDFDQLDLPQIVVVGSQSSGKSSVLENIVGRDFLPRGSGIVTRRPLVLQLIYLPTDEASMGSAQEWGEFEHVPNEMFWDFEQIRAEIERETERETGTGKGISHTPIFLKIYSPHVLNLTLVDLPGITKVPVGDQPSDIEQQVRSMIMHYISNRKALILAVTAGNTDIANSDALKLAKEVDPNGDRTLGVVTKLDLLDRGTDAADVLQGRVVPLKLGFIGVVNRSQEEINSNLAIRESLKKEAQFFQTHRTYRHFAAQCGTAYLAQTLNQLLVSHIRTAIPGLREVIRTQLATSTQQLASLGGALDGVNSMGATLLDMLTRYAQNYSGSIDGGNTAQLRGAQELYGGSRITYVFKEVFEPTLHRINPCDELTQTDILVQVRNALGTRSLLFVPESCFEQIAKKQIEQLKEPALRCLELVHSELVALMKQSPPQEMLRFPALMEAAIGAGITLLNRAMEPARHMIEHQIEIELAYINTAHPDFKTYPEVAAEVQQRRAAAEAEYQQQMMQSQYQNSLRKGRRDTPPPPTQPPPPQPQQSGRSFFSFLGFGKSSRDTPSAQQGAATPAEMCVPDKISIQGAANDEESTLTEIIKRLIRSYFDVVRKTICDTVPKAIMFFLVNHSMKSLQNELVQTLYKEERFGELLNEDRTVVMQRKKCQDSIRALTRAQQILDEITTADLEAV